MSVKSYRHSLALVCCLIFVATLGLAACNFAPKDDNNNTDAQLTIQALEFQLTLQAQNAQITALAQTVAAPSGNQPAQQPAVSQPVAPQLVAPQPTAQVVVDTPVPPLQSPASGKPFIIVKVDAPCLRLWSDDAEILDVIPAGQSAEIIAHSMKIEKKQIDWWPVNSPKGCSCWVSGEKIASITGDVSGLTLYPFPGGCSK